MQRWYEGRTGGRRNDGEQRAAMDRLWRWQVLAAVAGSNCSATKIEQMGDLSILFYVFVIVIQMVSSLLKAHGQKDGQMDGQMDEMTDGWTERQTDGWTDGRIDG